MRLIDAHDIEYEHICGEFRVSEEKINAMPTVCDIDSAIKSEGYMRGVNDDRNLWEHRIKQIRDEINGIEINGQIDEHTSFIRTGEQVKQMALEIIDKYKGDKE